MLSFCVCVVLCLGKGLATSWSLVQGVLPHVKKLLRNWIRGRALNGLEEPSKKNSFIVKDAKLISKSVVVYCKISVYGSTTLVDLGRFFSFLIFYTVGRTPWKKDQPVARPLPAHTTTRTQNKRTQTSMSWVGFEPTIPVFERLETIHALDRAATGIGLRWKYWFKLLY
jgi:hypothetical protein